MRWRSDNVEAPAGVPETSDSAGLPKALEDSFSGSDMVGYLCRGRRESRRARKVVARDDYFILCRFRNR